MTPATKSVVWDTMTGHLRANAVYTAAKLGIAEDPLAVLQAARTFFAYG